MKVNQHLTLRTAKFEPQATGSKSMVLFFPWLYASKKAIDKYCDLYFQRDMDVMLVNVELMHFMWPNSGKSASKEILAYLTKPESLNDVDNILVHSMSIGSYFYTVMMMEMAKHPERYSDFSNKIRGQIFDSLTIGGLDQMMRGISNVSQNKLVQNCMNITLSSYFSLTKRQTVDFYDQAVYHFKHHPIVAPSLFFSCLNDPMSSPDSLQDVIDIWKSNDPSRGFPMDVTEKCWPKSAHAGHLHKHPEEYMKVLETFLRKIQMVKGQNIKAKL